MTRINKEHIIAAKPIKENLNKLDREIIEYDKENKTKTPAQYKKLIKMCKEFETGINTLKSYGYKIDPWRKKLTYKYWEDELKEKNKFQNKQSDFDKLIKLDVSCNKNTNLYYIMLCWTNKNDYFVCGSVIDKIKMYFEKLKLEFFDTQTTSFPDRTEHCSTFKFKGSEETYNTIISSAEYIIDISASTIIEHCNVGVFGKKIE